MGIIRFNNKSSDDYGIVVEVKPHYEIAERAYESVDVPGSGEILMDLNHYKNVDREYQIAVIGDDDNSFASIAARLSDWLNSGVGYLRLEDTYYPDQYVLARLINQTQVLNILGRAGRATITFNRKPQRYLKSGETIYSITDKNNYVLRNPTQYESQPLVTVYGTGPGSITINDQKIDITDIQGYTTLDTISEEIQTKLGGSGYTVKLPKGYPVLKAGDNTFTLTGGITKVEVIPRWWKL